MAKMIGTALDGVKPYLFMILLQVGYAGMYIIAVASLKSGMSHFVLVAYRNAVAAVVMAPFALFFERKTRPKLTVPVFLKVLALAILEPVLDQNLYFTGAKDTSAGFASALVNVLPAVTFLLALVLRMEKVSLRRRHSQAKIIGTVLTVAGALLMVFYKGPPVGMPWNGGHSKHAAAAAAAAAAGHSSWLSGTFMVLASCVCWSGFFILQSNTLKSYPAELSLTVLICSTGALLSGSVALVAEQRDMTAWNIGFGSKLFTVIYAGVVCSGVAYYVQGLVTKQRGPVFVTAFNPLAMIITAVMGSIILHEEITLGSVIGAVIIVAGLYSLIWGKSKDQRASFSDSSDDGLPSAVAQELPVTSIVGDKATAGVNAGGK